MSETQDFTIATLGAAKIPSPIKLSKVNDDLIANYVTDEDLIIPDHYGTVDVPRSYSRRELLEKAGPREHIYFDPSKVHAAIVTCGGLCPGLNAVIRAIVMCLWNQYGVRRITGIRYGYRGFLPEYAIPTMELNPEVVDNIHTLGGTILGSSRGAGRVPDIVDAIERLGISMLFAIGGDGTQRGALAIAEEIEARKLKVAVVGIPKTIDNDLSFIQRSFGFETAVAEASKVITCANVEARGAIHGISLVKVMGRESGFIAVNTALASSDVDFVLVPEVPFDLYGDDGFYAALEKRVLANNHAVVLVAEGAGQEHLKASLGCDASGNKKLGDIGTFLKAGIQSYFAERNIDIGLRYIDPSYIIRAIPASPSDAIYCARLGTNAVHAAMSGRTKCLIAQVNNKLVHIPTAVSVSKRNCVSPESSLWRDVLEATGQPALMLNNSQKLK